MAKKIILVLLLSSIFLQACRKGKEDPLFSIHSRTARVAGDWKIMKFDEKQTTTYQYPNGSSLTQNFNRYFGPVNYEETTSDTGSSSQSYNGKISLSEFHFTKSGNWNSKIEYYLYVPQSVGGYYISKTRIEEEGKWEFNGKQGDLKNKETMELTTTSSNHFFYTYSTYLGTVIDSVADSTYSTVEQKATWRLIGLSNTRMKAEINSENTFTSALPGLIGTQITNSKFTEIELNQ